MDVLYPLFKDPTRSPLGHYRVFQQILRDLTKPSPDHLQVVAPKMFGKTVLLHHLVGHVRSSDTPYVGVAYWDLKSATPRTDDEFRQALAGHLKAALGEDHDFSSVLAPGEYLNDALSMVLDELERKDQRVLIVMDGFDFLLAHGGVTRHVLDELRSFGQKSSLTLVTGTRRPLSEVAMTDDNRTSELWRAFNVTPSVLKAFQAADWDGFLKPLAESGVDLDSSGKKELANWSGGVPVLAALILHKTGTSGDLAGREIQGAKVDAVAEAVLADNAMILRDLWDDLSLSARRVLSSLHRHELSSDEIADSVRKELSDRGFISATAKPKFTCRLMERYVEGRAGEIEDLRRLFGSSPDFLVNVRDVFELRLEQVSDLDPTLGEAVRSAVRALPNCEGALIHFRSVVIRALQLVWGKELGPDERFPDDWLAEWRYALGETGWWPVDGRVPEDLFNQVRCLELITGHHRVRRRLSRYLTKSTALLIAHLHWVGNYGQHQHPVQPIRPAAVLAFCHSAVELCHGLTEDLATASNE